jgi:glucan phosphoethanolaminetransferase (alkaline phosphatase superfamily)
LSVDLESLYKIIKHPIRRKIVLSLLERKELAYMDLMNSVEVENTGKLNYHLKILSDLIEKNDDGRYSLTEKGHLASQLLLSFPEKKLDRMPFGGGDAILIGFVGFVLALANPGFWGFGVGMMYLGIIAFSGIVYALLVPGGVMWLLTVRRTNSHDAYDLFKPPLVAFVLVITLLVLMAVLNINVTISTPPQDSGYAAIAQPVLPTLLIVGLFFFLGVGIFEILNKLSRKTIFKT